MLRGCALRILPESPARTLLTLLQEFRGGERKKTHKKKTLPRGAAGGACFQDFEICRSKICSGRREEKYDVDLRSIFYDFSQQASSFVLSTAACFTTFRRDLPLLLLNPYLIICAVTTLQTATQLEVGCLLCCVLRDEPSYPSTYPFRLACVSYTTACYTSDRHIIS